MPPERLRTAFWWALLLLSLAALLSYALLGWHVRLVADDYTFASNALSLSLVEHVAQAYQTWTGRWAQHVLLDLLASEQPLINRVVILAHGLMLVASLAVLLAELRRWMWPALPNNQFLNWTLSGLAVCVTLSLCHPESLYWAMPALAYVLPIALSLWTASLLLWGLRCTPTGFRRNFWGLSIACLLLFNSGMHEIYVLGQLMLLSIGGLVVLTLPPQRRAAWLPWIGFAWIVALLGALLFFAAPGNYARLSGSVRPVFGSAWEWIDTARENILHRHSLMASGLMFLAFWGGFSLLPSPTSLSSLSTSRRLALAIGAIFVASLMIGVVVLPPMIAYGHVPLRAQPPAMATLAALAAVLALLWRTQYSLPIRVAYSFTGLLGLLAVTFLVTNFQRLPDFMAYSAAWDAIDAAIRREVAQGARELEVPPMPVRLRISDNEWLHDQRTWLNGDMARYYGLDDIRLNRDVDTVTRVR
ncbi:MAG: DUF6056 family protein [Anaerolineae bacterium]|nr:DUF6056 family protein [Anaerolineae bacterium]MDW8172949.1 DUF6056 family protein [Anaerolineae bacterium]